MSYDYYINYIFKVTLHDQSQHEVFYKKEGHYDLVKTSTRQKLYTSNIYIDNIWHICNPKKIQEYQELICKQLKVSWSEIHEVLKLSIITQE